MYREVFPGGDIVYRTIKYFILNDSSIFIEGGILTYNKENNTLTLMGAQAYKCKWILLYCFALPRSLVETLPSLDTLSIECISNVNSEPRIESISLDVLGIELVKYMGYNAVRITFTSKDGHKVYNVYRLDGLSLNMHEEGHENYTLAFEYVAESVPRSQLESERGEPSRVYVVSVAAMIVVAAVAALCLLRRR